MAYANGQIPTSAMSALSVGGFLLPSAAQNFELWRAHAVKDGYNLTITSAADAFRTYAIQERIFRDRYTTTYLPGRPTKRWNNVTWYLKPGQATAAVPGTSNHGKGLAVDVRNAGGFGGSFYQWMSQTGPLYGWSNSEGRSINEPWHWVNDNKPRGALGTIGATIPREEEEEMTPDQNALLVQIHAMLAVPGQPFGWLQPINDKIDGLGRKAAQIAETSNATREALRVPGQPFDYPAATHNAIGTLIAEVSALRSVIGSVASGDGYNQEQLISLAEAAAKKAIESFEGTIDFKVK